MLDATLYKYTLSLPKNQTLPKIVYPIGVDKYLPQHFLLSNIVCILVLVLTIKIIKNGYQMSKRQG
jgi:hypothetical protein